MKLKNFETFISVDHASFYDKVESDWLPMQKLGHTELSKKVIVCSKQYVRKKLGLL